MRILRNGVAVSAFENGQDHYLTTNNLAYQPGTVVLGDGWNCSTPRYRFLMPPPQPSPDLRELWSVEISILGQGSGAITVGEPDVYIGGHYDGNTFVWGSYRDTLPEAHTQVSYAFYGDDARNLITLNPNTNLHELNVLLEVTCGSFSNEYYVLELITVDFVYLGVPDAWVESYLVAAGAEQTLREFDRSIADRWAERIGQQIFEEGVQKAIAFAQSIYDLDTDLVEAILELPSVFEALFDFLHVLETSFDWALFEIDALSCSAYEISQVQNSIGPMTDLATAWRDSLAVGCLPSNLSSRIASATQSLSGTITRLRTIARCMNDNRDACEDCASLKIQALSPLMLFDPNTGQEQHGEGAEQISYLPAVVEELARQQTVVAAWAPAGVSASDGTFCNIVRVTWNDVVGATGYKIYRSTSNMACLGTPVGTVATGANLFADGTAVPGQAYFYSVRATSACGDSSCGSIDSGYRGNVPSAPTGVSASDATFCDKIRVTWNAIAGATGYNVYRSTSNTACPGTPIGAPSASPFDDSTATLGQTYYYSVRATNTCGDSSCSSTDAGSRSNVPSAPTGVSATDGAHCDKVRVTWNGISGASGYKVYRSTSNSACPGSSIGNPSASPFDDLTATPGQTYYYSVKATNACGDSACSSTESGYRGNVPSAPTSMTAWDGTFCDKVHVTWDGVAGATGYKVYRSSSNTSCAGSPIGTPVASSFDDSTAAPGQTYYYSAKANNACGDSTCSSTDTGYRASAPSQVGVLSPGDGANDVPIWTELSWTEASRAVSYDVYFGTNSLPGSAELQGNTANTSWGLPPLDWETTYYWRVDSRDSCSTTPGPVWSFTTKQQPIRVVTPNGGEVWAAGSAQTIEWDSQVSDGIVSILRCRAGGLCCHLADVEVSQKWFEWLVSPHEANAADYTVRIYLSYASGDFDEDNSDGPFEVIGSDRPTVTLDYPLGSEEWLAGTTVPITWTAANPFGEVLIWLHKGSCHCGRLVGSVPMSQEHFDWPICLDIGDGADYRIELGWNEFDACGFVGFDGSGPITISGSTELPGLVVTQPSASTTWQTHTNQLISWKSTTNSGVVDVWLDGGNIGAYITSQDAARGSAEWCVEAPAGTRDDYRIRLEWRSDCGVGVVDASSEPFEVIVAEVSPGSVAIKAPSVGAVWDAGTTQTISWNSTSEDGYIELHLVAGNGEQFWIGDAPVADRSFEWTIWPYVGDASDYRIHATWWPECGPSVEATSEPFEITGSLPLPTLTLRSPNGGETFVAGSTYLVTWDATNAAGDDFCAFLYQGDNWADTLGCMPVSLGQLSWEVCPYLENGLDYRVHIQWCGMDICLSDESDLPFGLTGSQPLPSVDIINPSADTVWQAGTTQVITWATEAIDGQADLYWRKGAGDWNSINYEALTAGSILWQIPDCIGDATDYTIRVSGWPGCGVTNVETVSEPFEITGSSPLPLVTVMSPNGNEVWEAATNHLITWEANDSVGQVDVWLVDQTLQGDMFWLGSAPMEDGQLVWDVCPYIADGAGYTVRIDSCACGPCVSDESDAVFQIIGSRDLPPLLGDFNGNGLVDVLDYSQLPNCFDGPAFAAAALVAAVPMPRCGCQLFDWEQDSDVDLRDFAWLQNSFGLGE